MKFPIYSILLFNFLLFAIKAEIFEESISDFNISSDLYIDQEYKFTPDAEKLTNSTTSYEKRIFAIEFDEDKFCDNSYYEITTSDIDGVSYLANISDIKFIDMIASVFIEDKGILLSLDKYMNLHEFQVSNTTYERKYIQMIKTSEFNANKIYDKAWIFYSKNSDVIIAFCEAFHFSIYLSDITSTNKTNSNLLNCTTNSEDQDQGDVVTMIQFSSNNSKFFIAYSNFISIWRTDLVGKTISLKYLAGRSGNSIKDASLSGLNIYVLSAASQIITYSFSANGDDQYGFEKKNTLTIPQKLEEATFMVTKIGSANPKVNDKLFLIGGYQTGLEVETDSYCVIEFFVDSSNKDGLVQNRYYCSDEEIKEIKVFDRFAFVRRKSIHQFLYHSIPEELLSCHKTQSYFISQQLMHATITESGDNKFLLIALQMANQYTISMSFLEESQPKIICLADDSYGEQGYNLLYKMKTSHCENMKTSHLNGCKLYQKIDIDLKEYSDNSKTGLILGIIFGCIALLIICTIATYCCLSKRFQQQYEQLKESYEAEKYQKNKQQYLSPQPVKNDDVQIEL